MPTKAQADQIDVLLAREYDDERRRARVRRRLDWLATRGGTGSFGPSIFYRRSPGGSILGGLSLGAILGVVLPIAGALVVAGAQWVWRRVPHPPAPPSLHLDVVLNPIYSGVAWLLLRWHDLFARVAPHDAAWLLAIVFLVVTVRVILLPLVIVRARAMRRMRGLQPRIIELQRTYADDPPRLRDELARLFREERANPLLGCLPVIILVPAFLSIVHVIRGLGTDPRLHDAASVRLLGVPIVEQRSASVVVIVLVGVWAALAYLNTWSRLESGSSGIYVAALIVVLGAFVVPVGVMFYSTVQFLLALLITVSVVRRVPSPLPPEERPPAPDVAFGVSFVLALGAVAMLPFLDSWRGAGVALGGALVLVLLREWVPTWTGGLGPLRARGFLARLDAIGILVHDDGRYRFTEVVARR